jgi:uncharacterized membrane-anchored protein YhcB (DUF1043 family)
MSDETVVEQRSFSGAFLGLVVGALLLALGGLIWSYTLSNRLTKTETQLVQAQVQNDKLGQQLEQTNARLKVATDTLGQSVGLTQKQLETRANELMRRQEADAKRLEGERCFERENRRWGSENGCCSNQNRIAKYPGATAEHEG